MSHNDGKKDGFPPAAMKAQVDKAAMPARMKQFQAQVEKKIAALPLKEQQEFKRFVLSKEGKEVLELMEQLTPDEVKELQEELRKRKQAE